MYRIDGSYKYFNSKKLIEGMEPSQSSNYSITDSYDNSNNLIVPKTEMQTIIENIYLKLNNIQNTYSCEVHTYTKCKVPKI